MGLIKNKKTFLKSGGFVSNIFFKMALLFFLFTTFSYSQNVIIGKIIDGENGEPMRGATILLVGTKLGAYSDVKGEFKIKNVPDGEYSCKISFVGYDAKEITKISLKRNQTYNLGNIVLSMQKKLQEEIVIEATRVNDNQAAILAARKNAAVVSDGMSQEEISRTPDSDAGQSLKRVSGVTLVDNKFLFVRGVSERYSNTTLNGAALTSTEADKKAFAFDMFPSEFLQNVQISKSFTPDLPGNFAGGLVQLNTVDFPSSSALKISYSTTYNSNTNFKENVYFYSKGGSTDWLGIDDGTRKLPDITPATRREIDELRTKSYDPYDNTGAKDKYQKFIQSFNDQNLKLNKETVSPISNSGIGLSYSDIFNLANNDLGLIASINYSNSYQVNTIERNALMSTGQNFFVSNGSQATRNINWGALLNISYKIGSNSSISLRNVYNRNTDDESSIVFGQDSAYQFRDYKNYSAAWIEKSLVSSQLVGEHNLKFLNNSLLNWRFGYSRSSRYEPDYRRLKFDRDLFEIQYNPNLPYEPLLVFTEFGDPNRLGRYYSDLTDNAATGSFDLTIPTINNIKIKVGTLYEYRDRDFSARSFSIVPPALGYDFGEDINNVIHNSQNPDEIFAKKHFRVEDGFRISEASRLSDTYDADENLWAGYFMLDIPFEFLSQEFRFIGGVRYEDNKQVLRSYEINDQPITINNPTQDFLPSINLIYKVTNNSNLRLAATQTLTRPSLREFAPYAFYDFINQILITGNKDLRRTLIQNYDIRYEIFPNPGEVLSVSLFAKTFENAIEETIYPQQSELTKSFANSSGTAKNLGVEFEIRKGLGFITEYLNNFAVNINLSLINTEIQVSQGGTTVDTRQMWGQSPYSFNLGLYYFNPNTNTSVNFAYNTYGKRIIQVALVGVYQFADPHIYELPRNLIDLSINQVITGNLEAKLAIKDLLNEPLVWEQGNRKVASTLRGTNISLGISYKIF